jgi:hypothetical protein
MPASRRFAWAAAVLGFALGGFAVFAFGIAAIALGFWFAPARAARRS